MIVAKDHQWVICTPKKCGTHSLNSLLTDKTNHGIVITPWHTRMYHGEGIRILIVRNPYERFLSMYYFTKRVKSAWHKKYDFIFATWANMFFADKNSNDDWQFNCTQYAEEFQPDKIFKLEELDTLLHFFDENFGIVISKIPQLNTTKDRPLIDQLDQLSDENLLKLDMWAAPDLANFNYSP